MTSLVWFGKPHRDQNYLLWVKSLPSAISGQRGCDAHHLIGHGGIMGSKVSDYMTFPLTREEHEELHRIHWAEWERQHGTQHYHVVCTLMRAIDEGKL